MPTFKHPCPHCGTYIERDVSACPFCGSADPFAPARCPNCSATIEDPGWAACPKCGQALPRVAAPQSPASATELSNTAASAPQDASPAVAPPAAKKCTGCGGPLTEGARFCTVCGTLAS